MKIKALLKAPVLTGLSAAIFLACALLLAACPNPNSETTGTVLKSIELSGEYIVDYTIEDELDLTGLVITGTYSDGSRGVIDSPNYEISGYDPYAIGSQTVTITVEDISADFEITVAPPEGAFLESIELSGEYKTSYTINEELDLTGLVVTGIYSDGTIGTLISPEYEISGYDPQTVGEQAANIIIKDTSISASFKVSVAPRNGVVLNDIELSGEYEIYFAINEELDLTGLVVTGIYSDGTKGILSSSNYTISGYDSSAAGVKNLLLSVKNTNVTKSLKTPVEVQELILERIKVRDLPKKQQYAPGETLALDGLVVIGHWSDGRQKSLDPTVVEISGYDKNTQGEQTVVITVKGTTITTSFTVFVTAPILESIEITSYPKKLTYALGEDLDPAGLIVTGIYSNQTTKSFDLSNCSISGYKPDTQGNQKVSVTVEGKTKTFTVKVTALTVRSIAVSFPPARTIYYAGEQKLDPAGLVITATWSNGTTGKLNDAEYTLSGYNLTSAGDKVVTVTSKANSVIYTTFNISVVAPVIVGITIKYPPNKITFHSDESLFDPGALDGFVVTGFLSNGATKELAPTEYGFSQPDARGTVGRETVIVYALEAEDKKASFDIYTLPTTKYETQTTLQRIEITNKKTKYVFGEDLDLSSIEVTGHFGNLSSPLISPSSYTVTGYEPYYLGENTLTVTVTDINIGAASGTFTVNISKETIKDWLNERGGGNTAANPISMPLMGPMGGGQGEFALADIFNIIAGTKKYVNLDLSACKISGTEFNPRAGASYNYYTGQSTPSVDYIIGLVLPAAAKSVPKGNYHWEGTTKADGTFVWFKNLKTLRAAGLTEVAEYAFAECYNLESVDLPEVKEIGTNAFAVCERLTTVSIPGATEIGYGAFQQCKGILSISAPHVVSVGADAFKECLALTTVNLSAAESIGERAFEVCQALATVNLTMVKSIGADAFKTTGSKSLNIVLGMDAPALGSWLFRDVAVTKTVTVIVPRAGRGYGSIPAAYTGVDNTNNWGNAFRGMGSTFTGMPVNKNITLKVASNY
ncbi:MAG: bacterial Ig-like domain-containing protein [Treponema sp.]|jgi:hypothetical protein|nr:bacterial Ig-like domain-containing protein [Treponema sp.]